MPDGDVQIFGYLAEVFFAEIIGDVVLFGVFAPGETWDVGLFSLELFPHGDGDIFTGDLSDECDDFGRLFAWSRHQGALWCVGDVLPYGLFFDCANFTRLFFEGCDDDVEDFWFVFVLDSPDGACGKVGFFAAVLKLVVFEVALAGEVELASADFVVERLPELATGYEDVAFFFVFAEFFRFCAFCEGFVGDRSPSCVDGFFCAECHLGADLAEYAVIAQGCLDFSGEVGDFAACGIEAFYFNFDDLVAHLNSSCMLSKCALVCCIASSGVRSCSLMARCLLTGRSRNARRLRFWLMSSQNPHSAAWRISVSRSWTAGMRNLSCSAASRLLVIAVWTAL